MIRAWEIVAAYEASIPTEERRRRGAWYTPRPVVEQLCRLAIDEATGTRCRFLVDPTCGAGGILLGALDRLTELGVEPQRAVERVGGVDLDPGAVAAARAALDAWCVDHRVHNRARFAVADALTLGAGEPAAPSRAATAAWPRPDLVLGNPPFASPLRGGALPGAAAEFRRRHRDMLGPYADLAALHLWQALSWCTEGGRVCLILPQSLITSRDASVLRERISREATTQEVWVSAQQWFEAAVRVFAPILVRGGSPEDQRGTEASWAERVAGASGVPAVPLGQGATLADLAHATAGFRDEFYGLAELCVEASSSAWGESELRLVTSGALDPLWCRWGQKPTRLAGRRWDRPVVDPRRASGRLGRWVEAQRRPKVLVATQTKVLEPVIDRAGALIGVTPVIAVFAPEEDLDRIAALLLAPCVVAWAERRWFGSALSADALRPSARRLLELPLPVDASAWDEAAAVVATVDQRVGPAPGAVEAIARSMVAAYGLSEAEGVAVTEWWRGRAGLPSSRPGLPAESRRRAVGADLGAGDPWPGTR